ncbi:MAG: GIY-YIG nuclease family protein [Chloroflexi bacterium]|nr:GIY-YIG nuclease family protein [Chloroflexota bacterium]
MSYSVYILRSERNGCYYTGYSADPIRRLQEHNDSKVKATRYVRPWTPVYTRQFEDETVGPLAWSIA